MQPELKNHKNKIYNRIKPTTMQITHNPTQLTEVEKQEIEKALSYSIVYGVGLIFIKTKTNTPLSWNCSNSVGAKKYLDELKIPEVR